MSFPILGSPKPQFLDTSGDPYDAGTLSVLEPTDDTNKAYYPTADDADADTNSASGDLTLDSRGGPTNGLYGIDDQKYKLVLKDSDGTTIWTEDDIRLPTRLPTLYGKTAQTLTDAGAVTVTESTTFVVTTTASALTLVDGEENQHKFIVMSTDGGAATLTPSNLGNGTTIIFNNVGDSADLVFVNSAWHFMGGSATVTGYGPETAVTFTSTDATPDVNASTTFVTAGTTAITDFDLGVVGQTIKIIADSIIKITDGSPINLNGATDFNMIVGDTLTLHMFVDQVWQEVGRKKEAAYTKFKTADEAATNDDTLSDDTHLLNWNLAANTRYKLTGHLKVNPGTSSTPDIKLLFTTDNAFVESYMMVHNISDGAIVVGDSVVITAEITTAMIGNATHSITLAGHVLTHATSICNVDFQWAQGTSDAQPTTIENGSWISFDPLT